MQDPSSRSTPRSEDTDDFIPGAFALSTSKPTTLVLKRTSTPSAVSDFRKLFRILTIPSVPRCGLPVYRMCSGAPCLTKVSSTCRTGSSFLPILVVSLASDHVPAPPSPKLKLDSGLISRRTTRRPISFPRSSTFRPRSHRTTGTPDEASCMAANSPAGPEPTTTTGSFSLLASRCWAR